ncbi:MAG: S41 family peptidase, partial [Patescibacteria group bacterium]
KKIIRKKIRQKKSYVILQMIILLAMVGVIFVVVKTNLIKEEEKQNIINANVEEVKKDIYTEFLLEVFDKIKTNYWETIADEKLVAFYKTGIEKIAGAPQTFNINDRKGLEELLIRTIKDIEEKNKKAFTIDLAKDVMYNLQPVGRSGLYISKEEENSRDTAANIDKGIDYYNELEVAQGSLLEEVEEAYQEESQELNDIIKDQVQSKEAKTEADNKKEKIEQETETFSDENKGEYYDIEGVESTTTYKLISPDILYIHLKKMSPTTYDEFQNATAEVDHGEVLDTLILDLRDNLGGAIDLMQYFLGPFIGPDQYAYEFYHQGEKEAFKTRVGWMPSLVRYKKVVILINGQTQSSAEIMAATLKKYNVGIVVGTPTKGWGTVENTFPLENTLDPNEKYSLLLVHSVTLRDDNELIEGRGVDPLVNINDPKWKEQLYDYIPYDGLVKAVEEALGD